MNALEVKNLTCSYGRHPVLRNVSFDIEGGEFFIIIGPNGSGKTTLMKALAGMTTPQSGSIRILQKDVKKYSRRQMASILAVVPQYTALDFPFTVEETILMGRAPSLGFIAMEGKHDYDLTRRAMQFTETAHLADRRLDQLSGGERQRAVIARAICQEPKIILLDEPTASLDPAHQIRIMDLMERLRTSQNVTVVMVSHDLNLASLYANRLLLLGNKGIEYVGSPMDVLSRERLERVYGCTFLVEQNPPSHTIRIFPVSEEKSRDSAS